MTTRPFGSSARSVPAALAARRIRGPAELLLAVPYLLGFHPRDSLVLVGLHDGELMVTARIDRADAVAAGGTVLTDTVCALRRGGASAVIAVLYEARRRDGPPDRLATATAGMSAAVQATVNDVGCELIDLLLVDGGRWRSLLCERPDCCPPEGRALPDSPTEFTTAATVAGVVALPDRTALEALLAPGADDARARLVPLLDAAERQRQAASDERQDRQARSSKRAVFAAARDSARPRWCAPGDEQLAGMAVALREIPLRDAVWMAIDDGRLDGRPLWRDLARRVPAPYDAAALFLYGWASYRAGDGALAGIAATRAVASDPGYTAADLLLAALSQGVDPRRLPRLRLRRPA